MRGDDAAMLMFMLLVASAVGIIFRSLTLRYRRRELQHKERLAALEKGAALPELTEESQAPWSPRVYLLRGMIWLFSGIGFTLFLAGVLVTGPSRSMEDRLWEAKRLREMGATEQQIGEAQKDTTRRGGPPLGMALMGLAPIGVGLAYLIYYRSEKDRAAG